MAYLDKYKYDIFISYIHVDNEADENGKGWVDQFECDLRRLLRQKLSKKIEIWRDTKVNKSQAFNDVTKEAINETAVFIALTSPNFLYESKYCKEELQYFYQKTKKEPCQLIVNEHYRIVNIILYDIPHEEWPQEYGKFEAKDITGFPFYLRNESDPTDDVGTPLSPKSELYCERIYQLANAIRSLLRSLKLELEQKQAAHDKPGDESREGKFTIYFADVPDSIWKLKENILYDIKQQECHILESAPPPKAFQEHEKTVINLIQKSDLSIHLLDHNSGKEFCDVSKKYFPQRQAELGIEYAKHQLIWLPESINLTLIKDVGYKKFLNQLIENPPHKKGFKLDQTSCSEIINLILNQKKSIEQEKSTNEISVVLMDSHEKDEDHAYKLGKYLEQSGMVTHIITQKHHPPEQKLKYYEEVLKKVTKLIICFGVVTGEWVSYRLKEIQKLVALNNYPLKMCGIYLAPPKKGVGDINFILQILQKHEFKPRSVRLEILDNSEKFDPEKLSPILE